MPTGILAVVHSIYQLSYDDTYLFWINAPNGGTISYSLVTKTHSISKFNLAVTAENIGGYMSNFMGFMWRPYFVVFQFETL